tara:strand:+ start:4268 stop:4654 length:387 start_codon:yes stop_codon:yes gene_type:complete
VHDGATGAKQANMYDHEAEYERVTTGTSHVIFPAFLTHNQTGLQSTYSRNRGRWRARMFARYTMYSAQVTGDLSEVTIVDLSAAQQEINRKYANELVNQAQVAVIPRLPSFAAGEEEKSDGTDETVEI